MSENGILCPTKQPRHISLRTQLTFPAYIRSGFRGEETQGVRSKEPPNP